MRQSIPLWVAVKSKGSAQQAPSTACGSTNMNSCLPVRTVRTTPVTLWHPWQVPTPAPMTDDIRNPGSPLHPGGEVPGLGAVRSLKVLLRRPMHLHLQQTARQDLPKKTWVPALAEWWAWAHCGAFLLLVCVVCLAQLLQDLNARVGMRTHWKAEHTARRAGPTRRVPTACGAFPEQQIPGKSLLAGSGFPGKAPLLPGAGGQPWGAGLETCDWHPSCTPRPLP